MRLIVVTGTGTGVGKTITTAALAACGLLAGQRVAVVKPVQTGVRPDEPGDLAEIQQLTGITDLHEYVRYAEPLAPATAARRLGERGPDMAELAERIAELNDRDLVLIEGAGGPLVRFNDRNEGICELANAVQASVADSSLGPVRSDGPQLAVVLVTSPGLGALHDAAAAAAVLRQSGLGPQHLVIGAWPSNPGLAERCNLTDLASYTGASIHGVIASRAGQLRPDTFAELAVRSLTPALGGTFDAADFIAGSAAPLPEIESRR